MGYVSEEKTFDTSFCALPLLKPSGILQRLCGCSLTLSRGQPLGIKKVQELIYLYIYVDMESHEGDKAECQERRFLASAEHWATWPS